MSTEGLNKERRGETVQFNVRIPQELRREARIACASAGTTIKELVVEALRDKLAGGAGRGRGAT